MAALHMVWNCYGPSQLRMEHWCRSTRLILTDMGPEFAWGNSRNTLQAFFSRAPEPGDDEFLFQYGLRLGGVQHLIDSCVYLVVTQKLEWYPSWVPVMKHVAHVLCYDSYTDVLAANLREQSLEPLAKSIESPLESFAKWRWGSLIRCSRGLKKRKEAAVWGWDDQKFDLSGESLRDTARVMGDDRDARLFWARLFSIVLIFGLIEDFRGWCRGCACHEADRRAGRVVVCKLGGRRARFLWDRVQELLQGLRDLLTSVQLLAEPWFVEFSA